jgi:Zn-dependent protease with chaperone function
MRRFVLTCILRLGRYAVLPVVALAGALFFAWLVTLDRHTMLALATAPIVFCAVPAAMALGLGILLLPSRKDRNPKLDEAAAPGLWMIWKELDHAFARSSRTLLINADFNASISEQSRYAGLFRQQVTMTVGLPLLIVLDERAIRAVVAHEVAHAQLRHTSGGTNLFDFLRASESVLHYADPDRTVTGRIAHVLLHSMLEWLDKEYRALSRENELYADGRAAEEVGRDEMVRALVLMEGASARLTDLVFAPLEKEMLGAISAPMPPLRRISDQLTEIRAPQQLAAAAAANLEKEADADSTHPSLGKRLANLGFTAIPSIDEIQASAIDRLLSQDAARELSARFDNEWRKKAQAWLGVGR